jgi:ribosomal protein L37AE/L43A
MRVVGVENRVTVQLQPTSRASLDVAVHFEPERQRPRLKLQARSKPVSQQDMGDGGEQWSSLNVSVERKKARCAECTRPISEPLASSGLLLCERCVASNNGGRTINNVPSATATSRGVPDTRKESPSAQVKTASAAQLTAAVATPTSVRLGLTIGRPNATAKASSWFGEQPGSIRTSTSTASPTKRSDYREATTPAVLPPPTSTGLALILNGHLEKLTGSAGVGAAIAVCLGLGCISLTLRLLMRQQGRSRAA